MNSDRFIFIAKEVRVGFMTNSKISLSGFFARKNYYKKFCADNGIDLPLRYDRKHILPDEYLIRNHNIEYLFKIRDKMIVEAYDAYRRNDDLLDAEISNINSRIENMKTFLKNEDDKLHKVRALLSKEKDPQQYIFYESKEYEISTKIANQTVELNRMNAWANTLMRKKHENKGNWNHQVDIINGYIKQYVSKYINNLGKKIIKKLDFDEFTFDNFDYAGQAKEIMGSSYAKNKN